MPKPKPKKRPQHSRYSKEAPDGVELLTREFDEGNDDVDQIRSSLGVASTRRPASE